MFIQLVRRYEMLAAVTTPTETSFNNCVVSVPGYLSVNYNRTSLSETAAFFQYTPNYLGKMPKTGKRSRLETEKRDCPKIRKRHGREDNCHDFNCYVESMH